MHDDKGNILLVDDQPAKLLSYEVILSDLDENLIKAASGRERCEGPEGCEDVARCVCVSTSD